MKYLSWVLLSFLLLNEVCSQTYVPLGSPAYQTIERLDIRYGKILPIAHTSVKPFSRQAAAEIGETMWFSNLPINRRMRQQLKFLVDDNSEWLDTLVSRTERPIWIFYREPASLGSVDIKKNFSLRLNPVLAFRFGWQTGTRDFLFVNTRGAELRFNIKQRIGFYVFVTENQMRNPRYVRDMIDEREFIPGNGYWKVYRNTGIDFFEARGYVDVNVLKYINLQFGYDRHFIGNGIRSFYLSDFSAPFMFLKMNTKVWRFNYQTIWAELINQYNRGVDRELPKKYATFHHLNLNVAHFLDIGFFEGVIFNRKNHFEFHYLNPIIFYRAVEQSLGSPDNALIGFDIKANLFNHLQLYSQVVFDEFNFSELRKGSGWWANKYALQFGAKYIDVFPNLDLHAEFNYARPFMYAHNFNAELGTTANYTHYNQPLAHPLGANFYEFLLTGRYQVWNDVTLTAKYYYSVYGEDSLNSLTNQFDHFGGNIRRNSTSQTVASEYGNKVAQGARVTQNYFNFLATWQPWHNVYVDFEFLYRNKNSAINSRDDKTIYFGVGARMNIAHKMFEF